MKPRALLVAVVAVVWAAALPRVAAAEPPPSPRFARLWVGISGALDVVYMPAATDVCALSPATAAPLNAAAYYCTTADGADFPTRASPEQDSHIADGGHVNGGLQQSNERVLLAADYALTQNLLAGLRLGVAFDGYPGSAAVRAGRSLGSILSTPSTPLVLHLEARATYLFGQRPLLEEAFSPEVFAGAGISEFDAHVTTWVGFTGQVGHQPADVWLIDAPFFLTLGAGGRYQFSRRVAFAAAVRTEIVFGTSGVLPTCGPELTLQYGF
jgi:hypothetical protein